MFLLLFSEDKKFVSIDNTNNKRKKLGVSNLEWRAARSSERRNATFYPNVDSSC